MVGLMSAVSLAWAYHAHGPSARIAGRLTWAVSLLWGPGRAGVGWWEPHSCKPPITRGSHRGFLRPTVAVGRETALVCDAPGSLEKDGN